MKTYVLCGGKSSCCPVMTINENDVIIKDDFDDVIHITKEQLEILQKTKLEE